MEGSLSFRCVREDDHNRVQELHVEPMRELGVPIEAVPDSEMDDIESAYMAAGGEFIVGELDGEIVTMGGYRPPDGYLDAFLDDTDDAAELKRMRVDPAVQRQGIGQGLYDELERRISERGFEAIVLDTSSKQEPAMRFYESNGFERVHTEPLVYNDDQFELHFYRKSL